jgi:hypothetical protein
MTTPQQPQPSQGQPQAALALTVASALAGATTVAEATVILGPAFAAMKIKRAALMAALEVVMGHPPDRHGFYGPATARIARLNLMRRAQFLIASAKRLGADLARSVSEGRAWDVRAAVAAERRYYGQHMVAMWNRMNAAAQVDSTAMTYGRLLGWYTWLDSRTSPECRAANRHNFNADEMPAIGYPGAVHPHCRCMPGAPFPGAPLVGSATVGDRDGKRTSRQRPVPDHRPLAGAAGPGHRR